MKLIFLSVLVCTHTAFSQTPDKFVLKTTDCNVCGPKDNRIYNIVGDPWRAECEVIGNRLKIRRYAIKSGKLLSEEDHEYATVGELGISNSLSGDVKTLLDFKERKFYHGQVNILFKQGAIVTKTCIGEISY